ncbi:hypothetical protein E2C01_019854 [Portunus trituberculatus]|uniref:Uncharacterized protein n=1 Tax=Portunus trituberculatus TaxID=210409 RepID=A0A5B7E1J4_PORTR|nr:hypothetical protein [Portunus trituberculatus]
MSITIPQGNLNLSRQVIRQCTIQKQLSIKTILQRHYLEVVLQQKCALPIKTLHYSHVDKSSGFSTCN